MQQARKRQKLWPGPAAQASELVACPVCSKQVPLPLINSHLDTSCQASAKTSPARPPRSRPGPAAVTTAAQPQPASSQPAEALTEPAQSQPGPSAQPEPEPCSPHAARAHASCEPAATSCFEGYRLTLYHPPEQQQAPAEQPHSPAGKQHPAFGSLQQSAGTELSDEEASRQQHARTLQEAASRCAGVLNFAAAGGYKLHHCISMELPPAVRSQLLHGARTSGRVWLSCVTRRATHQQLAAWTDQYHTLPDIS